MSNHEGFFLDYPVVLILACTNVCICMCVWVCTCAWECVCMCVCVLLSWWETGREGMCMVGLQLNRWGQCLAQGHLTTAGVAAQSEPCRTNHCHGDGLWIPFIFLHHDTCLVYIRYRSLAFGSCSECEHENITALRTKGPWGGEGGGGLKGVCMFVCVWTCDTVIYYSWTMYLDSLYSAFLDWRSIYLGWLGFRHPDSVVGGLWKITIFARQLARGCLLPPPPPSSPNPITAGLQGWA